MEFGEYEITLNSPTIIVSKKGVGNFYSSTNIIPSTTLQGALARKAVINNILNNKGLCKNIPDNNTLPQCNKCPITDCFYRKIWINNELKICDALISPYDKFLNSFTIFDKAPPIMELESIFKDRINDRIIKDFLFYKYIFSLIAKKNDANPFVEEINFFSKDIGKFKKSPTTIFFNPVSKKIESAEIYKTEFFHIAINNKFKSTEYGALYNFIALNRGLKFRTIAIGNEDLLKFIEGDYKIGAAKSRGYGNISIKIIKKFKENEFIDLRAKNIESGFKKINEKIKFEKSSIIGTFTGLTPLRLSNNYSTPIDLLSSRLNLNPSQISNLFYKIKYMTQIRQENDGIKIINYPSIQSGYCGILKFNDYNIQELSYKLSKIEFNINNINNSSGWIYINHPIHYNLSII
ncbi:MAG: RAMP superfamily CRISPR-associated protein [Candidatus Helarchaeota archaeon]